MPTTKWDTSLLPAKCILLEYSVDPNDIQQQTLVRGYRGLSYASAVTIKTALDAQTTVTDPVIDGITFTGTWNIGTSKIVRVESGPLSGSHEVRQGMKYGVNTACMSAVNERLVRSRSYPIEQNENAWMYYELMQKEETKKWVNLSYAAALSEYEYLWKIFQASILSKVALSPSQVREYQIFYCDSAGEYYIYPYYPGYDTAMPILKVTMVLDTYYIVSVTLDGDDATAVITAITNPVFETWYEQEADNTYTMYRTLKDTSETPIMRYRNLQYAGMARVYGIPSELDDYITIYGLNDDDATIYEHAKLTVGCDTYRVTADCTGERIDPEDDESMWVWIPKITPEITANTEDIVDDGEAYETQVYFAAL